MKTSFYTGKIEDESAIYFDADHFNISSDGIVDVSDELQKAVNMVVEEYGYGIVFVPEGKYLLSKTIYIPKAVRIIGYGEKRPEFILKDNALNFNISKEDDKGHFRYLFWFVDRVVTEGTNVNANDANPGTFYSAMSNVNINLGRENDYAVAFRTHYAQHAFLAHITINVNSGMAGIYDVGNEMENLVFLGGEYGIYTTTKSDGSKLEHFVKISDCQEANGKVNWNHGTADEAKVSDDTKANGVDTASNEDPTMSTQFYIYLDNNSEIPDETPPTEEEHPGVATDDGRVEYDITVATVNHVNVKATVPLYVCMYGSNSSGAVVEPTNYRITNYSTVAIQVKNIKTSGPWTVKDVPGMEYYTGTDYGSSTYTMSNNTLHRGELYMRLRDKVLTDGDNAIDHSDTAWVIPKATGDFLNNKITGTAMRVPMAVYTATGNVNDANVCTPVTKVTYTIAPYGGTMPDEAEFEKVDSQDWLKDAS